MSIEIVVFEDDVQELVTPDLVIVESSGQGQPGVGGVTEHAQLTGRESDGHPASVITVQVPSGMTANQAQAAIEELLGFIDAHDHTLQGGAVPEAALDIANAPSDRYIMSYDGVTGKLKWLTSTEYPPSSLSVGLSCPYTGDLSSLLTKNDGNTLIVTELPTGNAPAFDVQVGFTGVTRFNVVRLYMRYTGGHTCSVQLWNKDLLQWDAITSFNSQTGLVDFVVNVDNSDAYINAGAVTVRFYHPLNGNVSHLLYLDAVHVLDSTTGGGGITDHSGLQGRSTADAHPASAISFSPTGGVSSTTLQNAVAELDTDKLNATAFSGFGSITVGPVQPASPQLYDLWVDTN